MSHKETRSTPGLAGVQAHHPSSSTSSTSTSTSPPTTITTTTTGLFTSLNRPRSNSATPILEGDPEEAHQEAQELEDFTQMSRAAHELVRPDFQRAFVRLTRIEAACRILSTLSCVFFFPLGLITLAAFHPRPRVNSSIALLVNFVLLLAALGAIVPLGMIWMSVTCKPDPSSDAQVDRWCVLEFCVTYFLLAFGPIFLISVAAIICAALAGWLEKKLLQRNTRWFLVLRNDPTTLTDQIDRYEIAFRKLRIMEGNCLICCILLSFFMFPLGPFLLLAFRDFGIRERFLKYSCLALLLLDIALMLLVSVFSDFAPFLVMLVPSFIFLIDILLWLDPLVYLHAVLKKKDSRRLMTRRLLPKSDPFFTTHSF